MAKVQELQRLKSQLSSAPTAQGVSVIRRLCLMDPESICFKGRVTNRVGSFKKSKRVKELMIGWLDVDVEFGNYC